MSEPFAMLAEDMFHVAGRGFVITGRVQSGRVRTGDAVAVVTGGAQQPCLVAHLHTFPTERAEAVAGDDAGLLLRGFDPTRLCHADGRSLAQAGPRGARVVGASAAAPRAARPWWRFW